MQHKYLFNAPWASLSDWNANLKMCTDLPGEFPPSPKTARGGISPHKHLWQAYTFQSKAIYSFSWNDVPVFIETKPWEFGWRGGSRMNIIKKGLWLQLQYFKNRLLLDLPTLWQGLTSRELKFSLRWSIAWAGSIMCIKWIWTDQIKRKVQNGTPRTFLIWSYAQQLCIFFR